MTQNTVSTDARLIAAQIASGKPQAGALSAVMKAPDSRERPAHYFDTLSELAPLRERDPKAYAQGMHDSGRGHLLT